MDAFFKIDFRNHAGGWGGNVELATINSDEYVNIYLKSGKNIQQVICAHPDDAKALRDKLIEFYPIERQQEHPVYTAYTQDNDGQCFVTVTGPKLREDMFAQRLNKDDATRIADLMNAQGNT